MITELLQNLSLRFGWPREVCYIALVVNWKNTSVPKVDEYLICRMVPVFFFLFSFFFVFSIRGILGGIGAQLQDPWISFMAQSFLKC